jgi:glutamate/tyrosine decarboxylase-like PLP-dependent enzyme
MPWAIFRPAQLLDKQTSLGSFSTISSQDKRLYQYLKTWIQLARDLFDLVVKHPELEAFTQNLSITTFRYVPRDLKKGTKTTESYLNQLNTELLSRLQKNGEVFVSNAVIRGTYVLRTSIVNFRTSLGDIEALPGIVVRVGNEVDEEIRPEELR